jgi:hypothetical protein
VPALLTIAGGIIIAWIVITVLGALFAENPDGCLGCIATVVLVFLLGVGGLILWAILQR